MQTELNKRIVAKVGTPVFIYDKQVLLTNIQRIQDNLEHASLSDRMKIYLAYFTNSNPHLFKLLEGKGVGVVLQSKEELSQLKKFSLSFDYIVSPSFLSDEDIDFWVNEGIDINLASLEEIKYFIKKYPNKNLCFRLDISRKQEQRTALKMYQLEELKELLKRHNKSPYAVHIYVGTGSSLRKMKKSLDKVFKLCKKYFPDIKLLNVGGGFAFDYDAEDESTKKHFDWGSYFSYFAKATKKYAIPDSMKFAIEPGRDVFADSGQLLLRVDRVVKTRDKTLIATDGSYVLMPSATIRERKHNVDFYDSDFNPLKAGKFAGFLSGNTTLSSDYVLPFKISIPIELDASCFLAVKDVGAYAATQHMEFLNEKPAAEVLIEGDRAKLIVKRGVEEDKIRYVLNNPEQI